MDLLSGGGGVSAGQYSLCGGGAVCGGLCMRRLSGPVGACKVWNDGGVSCAVYDIPIFAGVCTSCGIYFVGRSPTHGC